MEARKERRNEGCEMGRCAVWVDPAVPWNSTGLHTHTRTHQADQPANQPANRQTGESMNQAWEGATYGRKDEEFH